MAAEVLAAAALICLSMSVLWPGQSALAQAPAQSPYAQSPHAPTRHRQPLRPQTLKAPVPANLAHPEAPAQPLPYSHKKHLAFGLKCQDCHMNPDPGNQMGFPPTSKCMQCHVAIAKESPAIQKLAEYAKSERPIPWVRVYAITRGVTWTHRKHLDAGVKCDTCHGEVAQMDALAETTSVTAMAVCIDCHTQKKAPTACKTCHLWP
jgi:hypothetical protein